jgi:hypothetical protein
MGWLSSGRVAETEQEMHLAEPNCYRHVFYTMQ